MEAAQMFAIVTLSAGLWAFFYGLQLISPSLSAKLFWFNLKQIGATIVGPTTLLMVLQFTHQRLRHLRLLIAGLMVEPIVTQIILWTNHWHGLAGTPMLVTDAAPFPVLMYEFGPWFWFSLFISYLLFLVATFIVVMRLPGANKLYRKQIILLLSGLMVPWVAGSLGFFGFLDWHLFDMATFFFPVSGLLIGLGLFRYQLMQLSPVAYSAVFSSIRDGIMVLDDNGRIIETNPAALYLLGLRERELTGQQITDILPLPDTTFLKSASRNSAKSIQFYYEKGGQNRYLEVHGAALVSNIYISSGQVLILYDVTDRLLAEKARQFSENRYRTIFENDSSATIILEANMLISLANERFAELSGYSRREIEGKLPWTNFVHPDDLQRMKAYHESRRQNGDSIPNSYEFCFITKAGEQKDVYVSVALVPDSTISVASLIDITDRKLAEQVLEQRASELETAVRSEQERSAIILQSISDAIAVSDLDYKAVYVNPAFTQLTGYAIEDLLTKPAWYILNGRLPQHIWRQLERALLNQLIWEGEMQFKRKNGSIYDAAVLIAPVYDGNKQLVGYVSSHRDITQTKQIEEARRRFVTNISHELRTPVTNLKLYTDLLQRHIESERRGHYFEVLNDQIERLERIIKNTLEIAGLEDKRKALQHDHVHWESLYDSLQVRLQPQANEQQIHLKFEPSVLRLPGFIGDQQRLGQAIYELVHNALIFTQPGGQVTISGAVKKSDNVTWLTISVCDNGPGIDVQEQGKVFERFFRGKQTAAGHIPGTGLGLSMVKLIAEAHNGRITLQSAPHQGSTFTLWLPLS